MKHELARLLAEESADLADFAESLSPDEWEAPSLCAGWKVKHVIAHMAAGHTMSAARFSLAMAGAGFSSARTADRLARSLADRHSTEELAARFREGTTGRPRGATALVPKAELFTDHLIHHQDMRRPLRRPRVVPTERLAAAFDALPKLSKRIGSRQRADGLRVVADDLDRSFGSGPELRGPSEPLILALAGRADAAGELTGPGAEILASRLGHERLVERVATGPDDGRKRDQ